MGGRLPAGRLRAAVARRRCAPTSPPTRRRCTSATWRPSGTRSRSTSTTTSTHWPKSAGPAPSGRARTDIADRRYADLLPPQPLPRPLPDLQPGRRRARRRDERREQRTLRTTQGGRERGRAARACACGARRARRTTATAASSCRACGPPRTRAGWPMRSRSRAGGSPSLQTDPPGIYGEARSLGAGGPRAGHVGLPADRLPLARRGR